MSKLFFHSPFNWWAPSLGVFWSATTMYYFLSLLLFEIKKIQCWVKNAEFIIKFAQEKFSLLEDLILWWSKEVPKNFSKYISWCFIQYILSEVWKIIKNGQNLAKTQYSEINGWVLDSLSHNEFVKRRQLNLT